MSEVIKSSNLRKEIRYLRPRKIQKETESLQLRKIPKNLEKACKEKKNKPENKTQINPKKT